MVYKLEVNPAKKTFHHYLMMCYEDASLALCMLYLYLLVNEFCVRLRTTGCIYVLKSL